MGLLDGRAALVTGAARGNGAAIAHMLAQEGADVALFDIDGDDARAESERIADETGRRTLALAGDASSEQDAEAAVAAARDGLGRLDVLVNNAGILRSTPTLTVDLGDWQRILGVNLTGPLLFSRAAARLMVDAGGGAIVNITSIASTLGFGEYLAYCSSKGGLLQLTRAMALDLAPHGIRVNAVAPGIIHTDMTKDLYADADAVAEITAKIPLGTIAQPVEVAKAVLFLASDLASYVTGVELLVDAGYSLP